MFFRFSPIPRKTLRGLCLGFYWYMPKTQNLTHNLPLNTSLEVQQLDRGAVVHVLGFRCNPNCVHQTLGLWYLTVVVLEMVDMK